MSRRSICLMTTFLALHATRMLAIAVGAMLTTASLQSTAQTPTTVRGTLSAVSANTVTVKSNAGKDVEIQVTDKTVINFLEPLAVSDIKPGDFLAVTSRKNKDGSLSAFDVRRFPKPVNPGHRPFDGGEDQTMTNATLSATVGSAKERELVLSYEGGSQKVVLADNASITMRVPGERSHLVAGAPASVTADADASGKLTARSIEVRKPGVKPAR
jgi:Domain of unknown function (DUF5666)